LFAAVVCAMHVFQGAKLALDHGKKGQKGKEGSHGLIV
jgi:hypothetical protein